MSKPPKTRTVRSASPVESIDNPIEFVDVLPQLRAKSSRAGNPTARPVPKGKAKGSRSTPDYSVPISRIENPLNKVEKRSTRSASGIQKKRTLPDNSEDSNVKIDIRSQKRVRIDDENDDESRPSTPSPGSQHTDLVSARSSLRTDNDAAYLTPIQKGKSKINLAVCDDTMIQTDNHEDQTDISEDWNEDEMQLAFRNSRTDITDVAEGSNQVQRKGLDSNDPFVNVASRNVMPLPPGQSKKTYLEDLENFIVKTLPDNDGSYFIDVQDPLLRKQYSKLPPLRIGYLLSWSTSSPEIPHIPYSEWPTIISTMDIGKRSSIMMMITMVKQGRFFNPSRCSPLDVIIRDGYNGRREIYIGKQRAVAIITGYCTMSQLIHGKSHKSITVLFHGQEWERYCCFANMVFDQNQMIAQLYSSAITFSTLPDSYSAPPRFQSANISPLSGRRANIKSTEVERARGALYFSDIVPLFDARKVSLESSVDFENLANTFPRFDGEVPVGSCVAVGHSMLSYPGKKDSRIAEGEKTVCLGSNILFVIVFGVPHS